MEPRILAEQLIHARAWCMSLESRRHREMPRQKALFFERMAAASPSSFVLPSSRIEGDVALVSVGAAQHSRVTGSTSGIKHGTLVSLEAPPQSRWGAPEPGTCWSMWKMGLALDLASGLASGRERNGRFCLRQLNPLGVCRARPHVDGLITFTFISAPLRCRCG